MCSAFGVGLGVVRWLRLGLCDVPAWLAVRRGWCVGGSGLKCRVAHPSAGAFIRPLGRFPTAR